MKITEADVEYVAALAHLEVAAGEKKGLAEQLTTILDFVEQMNRLDLTAVEPTTHLMMSGKRAGRDDRVAPRTGSSEAGKSVKLFKVPKVIGDR